MADLCDLCTAALAWDGSAHADGAPLCSETVRTPWRERLAPNARLLDRWSVRDSFGFRAGFRSYAAAEEFRREADRAIG
jgi:hypothetical protein